MTTCEESPVPSHEEWATEGRLVDNPASGRSAVDQVVRKMLARPSAKCLATLPLDQA
jgi:hypothetical protein